MRDHSTTLRQAHEHIGAGRLDRAHAVLLGALRRDPGHPELNAAAGYVLAHQGKLEQAEYAMRRALRARPDDAGLLTTLGNILVNAGKRGAGLAELRRAVEIDPRLDHARVGLANALYGAGRLVEAAEQCRAGLDVAPGHPDLCATYATVLLNLGRVEESVPILRGAAAAAPDLPHPASALAAALNYLPGADPRETLAAHARYGDLLARLFPRLPERTLNPGDAERRLRIGLLSPDLRTHSVAFFLEPLMERLDRDRFEFVCYSTSPRADETTARLRSHAAQWRDIATMPVTDAAALVRSDGVDVLIDLCGHFDGHRLPVMRMRPAPLQLTYIGYPNTTGVREVDWRIVDAVTDPPPPFEPATDALAVERLARLDGCFLCYRPPDGAPEPAPAPPSAVSGRITFGSFNALQKLNDRLIGVWANLLRRAPGSRLLLKNGSLGAPETAADVAARFGAAGVGPDRLILRGPAAGIAEHLAQYAEVDVALDTFPYNGTTTTCEALFMGVPVVALEGRVHAGRVSASLLGAMGRGELIAPDEGAYVGLALTLAGDAGRLGALRRSLRGELLASPLCDGAGAAARFGALLRGLWARRCADRAGGGRS